MTDYAAMTEDGTLTIARLLPGPVERVWAYIVEPEKRARWIAGGTMEPTVGGAVRWLFDHSNISEQPTPEKYAGAAVAEMSGTVTRCEPPRLIAFTWFEIGQEQPSEVTITLQEEDGKVRLTLVHVRLKGLDTKTSVCAGWHAHLDLLGDLMEGRDVRDFWLHHTALEDEYLGRLT